MRAGAYLEQRPDPPLLSKRDQRPDEVIEAQRPFDQVILLRPGELDLHRLLELPALVDESSIRERAEGVEVAVGHSHPQLESIPLLARGAQSRGDGIPRRRRRRLHLRAGGSPEAQKGREAEDEGATSRGRGEARRAQAHFTSTSLVERNCSDSK